MRVLILSASMGRVPIWPLLLQWLKICFQYLKICLTHLSRVILNMKIMWTGPKRENKEILDDFARVLGQIYVRHTAAMDGTSFVDYESLAVSDALKEFLSVSNELQTLDPSALSFSEKMAFFLNVFNALIIQGFVALGPPTSLYQRVYFYNHTCLSIGNKLWFLNDIRDGILRGNQKPYMSYRRVLRRNDPRLACSLVVSPRATR